MKRLLLLLALTAAYLGSSNAQEFTLQLGRESKHTDEEMIMNGHYLGLHNGLDCWITQTVNGSNIFVRNRDWQVVHLDSNLVPVGRLELPKTSKCHHVASVMKESLASALLVDSSNNEQTLILRAQVDMDSMRLVGGWIDTLHVFPLTSKDFCKVWGATSSNGEYVGLISVIEYTNTKQYTATITLFDATMTPLWTRQYALGSTDMIHVSDKGEIITLAVEDDGEKQHFIFNVMDEQESATYDISINCDRIQNMRIVNTVGRHVVCAGTWSPLNSDPEDRITGGVVGMSFDLDSTNITGFTLRPFQNEDMNILMNKKTKKVQREQMLTFITPTGYAATSFGGVISLGRNYAENRVNNNGTISSEHHAVGMHVAAVDTSGAIRWVRNFRRNDISNDGPARLYTALVSDDTQVYLLKTESRKYPNIYEISKEAKEFELGDKSNIVLYSISTEGEVNKTIIEQKYKGVLIGVDQRRDGTMLLLSLRGSKTRLAKLKH